jgi:hypothetical protein
MFDQVSPEKEVNNYPKADRQNSSELMFDDEGIGTNIFGASL